MAEKLEWYSHTETRIQAIEISPLIVDHPEFKGKIDHQRCIDIDGSLIENCYLVDTSGGPQTADDGDFLIVGTEGEIYPCKRSVFFRSYQPALDPSNK